MTDPDRPSWDEVWMTTAAAVASRSLCSRAKVGAVIVSSDNVVRAASYNGPPPTYPHANRECKDWCPRAIASETGELSPTYDDCPSSHAEMNALARADTSRLAGATLYVTGAVCYQCAKVIPQTGITRVVHHVSEDEAHRRPDEVEAFLRRMHVHIERW